MKFSLNQKLALLAFILSSLALVSSVFFANNSSLKHPSEVEFITVLDLAESIKKREIMTLIDLRSKEDFNQFHIPTAINITASELEDYKFDSESRLIVYSENDSLSRKTLSNLDNIRFGNSRFVKGGVQDWYIRVLYPRMPLEIPEEDRALANRVKSLSSYFGGRSQFVDDKNTLGYYKETESTQPKIESKLVRMGC